MTSPRSRTAQFTRSDRSSRTDRNAALELRHVVLITAVLIAAAVLTLPGFKAAHQGWLSLIAQPHHS